VCLAAPDSEFSVELRLDLKPGDDVDLSAGALRRESKEQRERCLSTAG
jgi:hypothetical protein